MGFYLWEVLLLRFRWANICQIVHAVWSIDGILLIFYDLANIEAFTVLLQKLISEPLTFVAGNGVINAAEFLTSKARRLLVGV